MSLRNLALGLLALLTLPALAHAQSGIQTYAGGPTNAAVVRVDLSPAGGAVQRLVAV